MENARDDIPLDEPALAGAPGAPDEAEVPAAPPAETPVQARAARFAADPAIDRPRDDLHASFNDRISYLCKLVALIVALVALATMALGRELPQFVLMGLCLSVALLAIAGLQDHHQRKR